MQVPPLHPSGDDAVSPAWDMASPLAEGVCAHCGRWTEAGIAHWIPRASGPEIAVVVCADPAACTPLPKAVRPRRYPTGWGA
ncbi:hypothetical protein ACWEO4_21580 [Streptomyces sp. NPDC004393]|uniref:hypothetical protein n=1 Tax=Streptomyces sp. NPDC004533 TaxID=3154278 RepID=UPI0033B157F5